MTYKECFESIDDNSILLTYKECIESIAGSPRVEGDEEEEDTDDLENEFDIANKDPHSVSEAILYPHLSVGRGSYANGSGNLASDLDSSSVPTDIPLLTYGQEVNLFLQLYR